MSIAPSRDGTAARVETSRVALAMLGFAAVALFGVLSRPPLPVDETRYLAVAWEMHVTGDWLVPHLNGAVYAHKPPLLFWLINLVWAVFGVSETGARLVGPAFGTAAIGLAGLLARRLWPARPGVAGRAALVLAGFATYAIYAGLVMFDAILTVAVLLGALALTRAGRTPRWWLGLGAALGLGALAKGPVILAHLAPLALTAPLWSALGWRRTLGGALAALGVGLGIVGLWLVPAILAGGPAYRDAVLWTQSAARVGGSLGHGRPWWFFLALLPLIGWPWLWSREVLASLLATGRSDPGARFCRIWLGASLLLFSLIGGKQVHYLLPTLPAIALLVARFAAVERIDLAAAGLLQLALGFAALALAFGLIPGEAAAALARPAWASALVGVMLLVLAFATPLLRGTAMVLPGLALAGLASLAFLIGAPGTICAARPMVEILAAAGASPVGFLGDYRGEFTFAARLTRPLVPFATEKAAMAWLETTPGALLVARPGDITVPPAREVACAGRRYGVWRGGAR
ncbi:MAG: glycosyltransferase [Rhodovulum sulfidophilum]|uniref:Glycosyltransferase n=1 Tax=Rhodovulum sulfidophilum TaxID=35806 RepID=A0A2W5Q347_RHOSU|nr:MAG: glycosyltransferase [Rhodovulum sulfidophilum]